MRCVPSMIPMLAVNTTTKYAANPIAHLTGYFEPSLVTHFQCAVNAETVGRQTTRAIIDIMSPSQRPIDIDVKAVSTASISAFRCL